METMQAPRGKRSIRFSDEEWTRIARVAQERSMGTTTFVRAATMLAVVRVEQNLTQVVDV